MHTRDPYSWGGPSYPDYTGEAKGGKKKQNPGEQWMYDRAKAEMAAKDKAAAEAQAARATASATAAKVDPTLSQYEGAAEDTPFYKNLVRTGTEDVSRAYGQARTTQTNRARTAGFGYEQPISLAAQAGLDEAEAGDLASVPSEALKATTPLQFQAAQTRLAQSSQQLAGGGQSLAEASLADPEAYMKLGLGINETDYKRKQARMGMFKKLAGIGLLAAAPFTGGATSLALGSAGGALSN